MNKHVNCSVCCNNWELRQSGVCNGGKGKENLQVMHYGIICIIRNNQPNAYEVPWIAFKNIR